MVPRSSTTSPAAWCPRRHCRQKPRNGVRSRCHRAPSPGVGEEAVDKLLLRVTALRLGFLCRHALEECVGQVVQNQAALFEVSLCQRPLDPVQTLEHPVHGGIQIALFLPGNEDLAQIANRGGLGKSPRRGQLQGRIEDPCHDHGQNLIAPRHRLQVDQPVPARASRVFPALTRHGHGEGN